VCDAEQLATELPEGTGAAAALPARQQYARALQVSFARVSNSSCFAEHRKWMYCRTCSDPCAVFPAATSPVTLVKLDNACRGWSAGSCGSVGAETPGAVVL
jgi:hypothetical protein